MSKFWDSGVRANSGSPCLLFPESAGHLIALRFRQVRHPGGLAGQKEGATSFWPSGSSWVLREVGRNERHLTAQFQAGQLMDARKPHDSRRHAMRPGRCYVMGLSNDLNQRGCTKVGEYGGRRGFASKLHTRVRFPLPAPRSFSHWIQAFFAFMRAVFAHSAFRCYNVHTTSGRTEPIRPSREAFWRRSPMNIVRDDSIATHLPLSRQRTCGSVRD